MKDEINWNVVYTSSRQEKKVAQKLDESNFENYLPIIKMLNQWSDRKKIVEKPLFKGYVFVRETKNYEDILRIPGVVAFLKYNKKNAIVRQHEIDTIKSLIQYGYDITTFNKTEEMEIGEKVMIADGPLKGQVGELYSKNDTRLFVIHFENFGNSLQIKIPSNLLQTVR